MPIHGKQLVVHPQEVQKSLDFAQQLILRGQECIHLGIHLQELVAPAPLLEQIVQRDPFDCRDH